MAELPSYERIEQTYVAPRDVLAELPDSTERSRALEHLKLAESYTYQARERVKETTTCTD